MLDSWFHISVVGGTQKPHEGQTFLSPDDQYRALCQLDSCGALAPRRITSGSLDIIVTVLLPDRCIRNRNFWVDAAQPACPSRKG